MKRWVRHAGLAGAGLVVATACGGISTLSRDDQASSGGSAADIGDQAAGPRTGGTGGTLGGTRGVAVGGTGLGATNSGGTGDVSSPGVRITLGGSGGNSGGAPRGGTGGTSATGGGGGVYDACSELCTSNAQGCGAATNQGLCLDQCAPLGSAVPECAVETQIYMDCVSAPREPDAPGCSRRAEDYCKEQFNAVVRCAELCEESEVVGDDDCLYEQSCRGGDYQSACARTGPAETDWTCTCFDHGAWHGEQLLRVAPGENACKLSWCEFVLPPE